MPGLTDQSDRDPRPEKSPDSGPIEEPNEYAIRYLFSERSPQQELSRTGYTLVWAGAATNVIALLIILATLVLELGWLLYLLCLLIMAVSWVGQLGTRRNPPHVNNWGWLAPVLVITGLILAGLLDSRAGLVLFFTPGSLCMVAGRVLVAISTKVSTQMP